MWKKNVKMVGSRSITLLPWAGRIASLSSFSWSRDNLKERSADGRIRTGQTRDRRVTHTTIDCDVKNFSCLCIEC